MRSSVRAILWAGSSVALAGTALAADLTGAEIKALLYGKTVYLETTAASAAGKAGQGVIFWTEDGTALYETPDGSMMHVSRRSRATRIAQSGKSGRAPGAHAMTSRAT
jgi:hypothetical protein